MSRVVKPKNVCVQVTRIGDFGFSWRSLRIFEKVLNIRLQIRARGLLLALELPEAFIVWKVVEGARHAVVLLDDGFSACSFMSIPRITKSAFCATQHYISSSDSIGVVHISFTMSFRFQPQPHIPEVLP